MGRPAIYGVRKHVMLTQRQVKRISALSRKTGLPASEIMRRAIDKYLDDLIEKAKRNRK